MEKQTAILMKNAKKFSDFSRVKFIFLFGSQAYGKPNKMSDYDFVVFYEGNSQERFKFRLKLLGALPDNFDIQMFQDLPLYIKKEVFKGRVIYTKDLNFVYSVAYETIKRFNDFKKTYYDYIGMKKII